MSEPKIVYTFNLEEAFKKIDANVEQRKKYAEEAAAREKAKIENSLLFLQEAAGNGLMLRVPYDMASPVWEIEPEKKAEDFRTIKLILGELDNAGIEAYGDDARKRLVQVTLSPKDKKFNHLRFTYVRKLAKDDKCKIVRHKQSYTSVQCSV